MKIYELLLIPLIGILAKFAFDTMEDKTTKMRAVIREWGNLVFKSAYAIPSHGTKDVLVRIHSAAINPVDYKAPKIILGPIVGLDFSGVVESVGTSVTQFNKGDEFERVADEGKWWKVRSKKGKREGWMHALTL